MKCVACNQINIHVKITSWVLYFKFRVIRLLLPNALISEKSLPKMNHNCNICLGGKSCWRLPYLLICPYFNIISIGKRNLSNPPYTCHYHHMVCLYHQDILCKVYQMCCLGNRLVKRYMKNSYILTSKEYYFFLW